MDFELDVARVSDGEYWSPKENWFKTSGLRVKAGALMRSEGMSLILSDPAIRRLVSYRHDGNKGSHTREVSTTKCQPINLNALFACERFFEDRR